MFFNKNKSQELKEEPLGYWELESYMQIVPRNPSKELLDTVCDSFYYRRNRNYRKR